jgi:hypothetical protein
MDIDNVPRTRIDPEPQHPAVRRQPLHAIVWFTVRAPDRAHIQMTSRMAAAKPVQNSAQRLHPPIAAHVVRAIGMVPAGTVEIGMVAAVASAMPSVAVAVAAFRMCAVVAVVAPIVVAPMLPRLRGRCCTREQKQRENSRNVPHAQGFRRFRMNRE